MLLKYNQKNCLTLYIPGQGTSLTPYQLLPGMQEIEDSVWKKLKAQKGVKRLMMQGHLTEAAPPEKDNKKSGKGLAKYSAEEAEFIIKETYDKRLLGTWLKTESRTVIKTAIEDQLKVIEESVRKLTDEEKEGKN